VWERYLAVCCGVCSISLSVVCHGQFQGPLYLSLLYERFSERRLRSQEVESFPELSGGCTPRYCDRCRRPCCRVERVLQGFGACLCLGLFYASPHEFLAPSCSKKRHSGLFACNRAAAQLRGFLFARDFLLQRGDACVESNDRTRHGKENTSGSRGLVDVNGRMVTRIGPKPAVAALEEQKTGQRGCAAKEAQQLTLLSLRRYPARNLIPRCRQEPRLSVPPSALGEVLSTSREGHAPQDGGS
jgi:hypothetical protein